MIPALSPKLAMKNITDFLLRTFICASFLTSGAFLSANIPDQDVTAPNDNGPTFTAQGRSELGFHGSYSILDPDGGSSVDVLSGHLDFTYFILDNWALRPQYQVFRYDNATSLTAHVIGVGVDFHIPHENIAFYVGAAPNVGFVSTDDSDTDTEFLMELRGGIKHYLSQRLALNTQISYSFGSDYALTRATFGLSVLFGGD